LPLSTSHLSAIVHVSFLRSRKKVNMMIHKNPSGACNATAQADRRLLYAFKQAAGVIIVEFVGLGAKSPSISQ
jgi:hypothetical protein